MVHSERYPVHYVEGQTILLRSNEFFFIGDNADVSLDSRLLGPSDRSAIVGVVDLMYWPLSRFHIVR
jgi:type IV secretory pathway protease TraF